VGSACDRVEGEQNKQAGQELTAHVYGHGNQSTFDEKSQPHHITLVLPLYGPVTLAATGAFHV
jgi:hypothetical protein